MFQCLKEAFNGKGYKNYKSRNAKKKFADSLLKLADRLFFLSMSTLFIIALQINNTILQSSNIIFWITLIGVAIFIILGICYRHEGLKIYDYLEKELSKKQRITQILNPPTKINQHCSVKYY